MRCSIITHGNILNRMLSVVHGGSAEVVMPSTFTSVIKTVLVISVSDIFYKKRKIKEVFYSMTHLTHFIYGIGPMIKDHSYRKSTVTISWATLSDKQ